MGGNKVFFNALLVSILATLFGLGIHLVDYHPPDWSGFFMWVPVLWIIPFGLATTSYISERKNVN